MISVIMPFYKHERYIEEAIRSIIDQTYGDWELLLMCDDPDTDDLEEYEDWDERITYFPAFDHLGQAKRLTEGMDVARGKYIAFADADDISSFVRFEKSVKKLESGFDLVYGDTVIMGEYYGKRYKQAPEWNREILRKKNYITFSSIMVRTGTAKKVEFDHYGYGNSWIWLVKVSNITDKIARVPHVLCYYREGSSVVNKGWRRWERYKLRRKIRQIDSLDAQQKNWLL